MSVIRSKQLDYSKNVYAHGTYRLSKSTPLSGTQTVALNTSGGQEFLCELPTVKVINHAKGFLSFNLEVTAQGANRYSNIFADTVSCIRKIELYTRGGLFVCALEEVANYLKMVNKPFTKFDEYITQDFTSGLAKSNLPVETYVTNAEGTAGNPQTFPIVQTKQAVNLRPNAVGDGLIAASDAFIEPLYLLRSGSNAALTIKYKVPFSLFKNSILALDKDILYNEILVLRIVFNPVTKIGYKSDLAGGNIADLDVGTTSIKEFSVFTAVETDPGIISSITADRMSPQGQSLLFDYTYYNKFNLSGVNQSISLRYNRTNGAKLKKIIWSAFTSAETNCNAYNHNNFNDAATGVLNVSSFYSLLNNMRLQEIDIRCAENEDYLFLQNKIRGSVLYNSRVHKLNWVWIEDFTAGDSLVEQPKQPVDLSNMSDGLDLSVEQKYDIYATMVDIGGGNPNTRNHYCYSVCEKMLVMNAAGIMIM